jgi:hypothetical protein
MTDWVPADNKVRSRLRSPTSKFRLQRLLAIISGPSQPLPEDRLEGKTHLLELLQAGLLESLCQVIRDLSAYHKKLGKPMNDHDQIAPETVLGHSARGVGICSIPHSCAGRARVAPFVDIWASRDVRNSMTSVEAIPSFGLRTI